MKSATLLPFLLSLAGAMPAFEKKSNIENRQVAEIIEVLIYESTKWATSQFLSGPEIPLCADGGAKQGDYWARAYKTIDGKNVTVADMCWTSGGYNPVLADVLAAKCILGLHQNQASTCIDLKGSSCDAFPGTAVGNVEVYSGLSGNSNQQPDQYNIDRMDGGFQAILNTQHGWDIGTAFTISPSNDDGTGTGWTALIRGTGAADC